MGLEVSGKLGHGNSKIRKLTVTRDEVAGRWEVWVWSREEFLRGKLFKHVKSEAMESKDFKYSYFKILLLFCIDYALSIYICLSNGKLLRKSKSLKFVACVKVRFCL